MSKFYQSKYLDKEYLADKFRSKKNKNKPQINKNKAYQLLNADKLRWLKFTYITESINDCLNIVKQLEQLIYQKTNRSVTLKCWNPYINKNVLEFYLQLNNTNYDFILYNYSKLETYRLKCHRHDNICVPVKIPSDWLGIIRKVLQSRFNQNLETNETVLNLSHFYDDPLLQENGLLLELSSNRIFESILNLLRDEIKTLTLLDISDNKLTNILKLKYFLSVVNVGTINLSNNDIREVRELNILDNSSIINLNLSNNPISQRYNFIELKKKIRQIIPSLRVLNGKEIGEDIAIAGEMKSNTKLPTTIKSPNDSDAFNFIWSYFLSFDAEKRDKIVDFYSTDSVLTMATHGESSSYFKNLNSNSLINKCQDTRIKRGKAQILGCFVNFPVTRHIKESLNVEVITSTDTFMMLMVTGAFLEVDKKDYYRAREFSRSMFIVNGGIVLQDFVQIFPYDSQLSYKYKLQIAEIKQQIEFAKSHKDFKNFSAGDIEIVRQFQLVTRMKVDVCLNFLKAFQNNAYEEFEKMKASGSIPADALI